MEPHTIIQVTPATPSSTDSGKTNATNMLDNLLDELQTFAKTTGLESTGSSGYKPGGGVRGAFHTDKVVSFADDQLATVFADVKESTI